LPSVPQLAAVCVRHVPDGSAAPAATCVQVPRLAPGSAHERQVPVQLLAQHTPCWQMPDAHSVPPAQPAPLPRLVQTPPTQTLPPTQWASPVQVVRHWLLALSQANEFGHGPGVTVWHTPAALQVRGGATLVPLQPPAMHTLPAG
jgi:hypothetical protein